MVAGVSSSGINLSGTVLQRECYIVDYPVGMIGDYGELIGSFSASDNIVSDKVGDKAIGHTQSDRLVVEGAVFGIDKKRNNGYGSVESEGGGKEIGVGTEFADVFGDYLCAAAGGVVLKAYSADNAAQHTAYQCGEDGIAAVGVIFQKIKGKLLQPKERK